MMAHSTESHVSLVHPAIPFFPKKVDLNSLDSSRSDMVIMNEGLLGVSLWPLFLVPIVNVLPILVDYIMAKVYGLFGWEYRKFVRVPPSCPYKPPAATALKDKDPKMGVQEESIAPHPVGRPSEIDGVVDLIAKDKAA